jgi:PIN domain nuclease of toxin-antitoxin system
MKYLLDTQIVIWVLEKPSMLKDEILNILNSTTALYISIESLREVVIKQKSNEIAIKSTLNRFCELLKEYDVKIVNTEINHIKTLNELTAEKSHKDPFDHLLISVAISGKFTFISADKKFPYYRNQGLELIGN